MRVRMKETRNRYEAGKSYDLPDELAWAYIRCGRAYLDKSLDGPPETKPAPVLEVVDVEVPAPRKKRRVRNGGNDG